MTPLPDPILDGAEIQGDILAGFRKDHVRLLFVTVADVAIPAFKKWISRVSEELAYTDVVHEFNARFSSERRRLKADPPMQVTWLNFALTGKGSKRLLTNEVLLHLDSTFLDGPMMDADSVGEPALGLPDGPQTWLVGGRAHDPDALLIVAGDDPADVEAVATSQMNSLTALSNVGGVAVHIEFGATRAAQRGHEHFGFKDGISQPGVRGRLGSASGPQVSPRIFDAKDPLSSLFSAPGQPLCWPGEFVLGYPRMVEGSADLNETVTDVTTHLTKNGSYLVYRRLSQDVPGFNAAAARMAEQISQVPSFGPRGADFAAACLVGRWPSGAPLMRSPFAENKMLGDDNYASNNFFYTAPSAAPIYNAKYDIPADTSPQASDDTIGNTCPYSAHIRKVNPRDQHTDQGFSGRTLVHRILRRGVPFGPDFDVADVQDHDRGLQFLCYQSSIARGFQFLMNQWANSQDFPLGRGHDVVIGQVGSAIRQITILAPDGAQTDIDFPARFVKTTGAAYLFSPSRTALVEHFGA